MTRSLFLKIIIFYDGFLSSIPVLDTNSFWWQAAVYLTHQDNWMSWISSLKFLQVLISITTLWTSSSKRPALLKIADWAFTVKSPALFLSVFLLVLITNSSTIQHSKYRLNWRRNKTTWALPVNPASDNTCVHVQSPTCTSVCYRKVSGLVSLGGIWTDVKPKEFNYHRKSLRVPCLKGKVIFEPDFGVNRKYFWWEANTCWQAEVCILTARAVSACPSKNK